MSRQKFAWKISHFPLSVQIKIFNIPRGMVTEGYQEFLKKYPQLELYKTAGKKNFKTITDILIFFNLLL